MQNAVDLIAEIVRNAGKIMLDVNGVSSDEGISEKSGDANYVTVFDVRVQTYLINQIKYHHILQVIVNIFYYHI